ncbi:OTU-domain-containing protein [Sesbania bispinosa]|nr:OTU-domain-containing protein [Sesbania bispinosa]
MAQMSLVPRLLLKSVTSLKNSHPENTAHGDWLIVTRKKRTTNSAKNGKTPPSNLCSILRVIVSTNSNLLKPSLDTAQTTMLDPKPPDYAHTTHKLLVQEDNMESDESSEEEDCDQDQSQDDMEA